MLTSLLSTLERIGMESRDKLELSLDHGVNQLEGNCRRNAYENIVFDVPGERLHPALRSDLGDPNRVSIIFEDEPTVSETGDTVTVRAQADQLAERDGSPVGETCVLVAE